METLGVNRLALTPLCFEPLEKELLVKWNRSTFFTLIPCSTTPRKEEAQEAVLLNVSCSPLI